MTLREEGNLAGARTRHTYNSFSERYPDYMDWLDEAIWVLDIETEIHEPIQSFRASMRYQAKEMNLNLVTRVQWREINGESRKVLLIQAVPAP